MKTINIGLKPDALLWLGANAEKEPLSVELKKVEYAKSSRCDAIDEVDLVPLYQFAHTDRLPIRAVQQHSHISDEVMVIHLAIVYNEEMFFAWTDAEAQVAYDRYSTDFGGSFEERI